MGVGLALYAIASFYEWLSDDPIIKHTVKCKYCRKWISVKVGCSSFDGEVGHLLTFCTGEALCELHKLGRRERGA